MGYVSRYGGVMTDKNGLEFSGIHISLAPLRETFGLFSQEDQMAKGQPARGTAKDARESASNVKPGTVMHGFSFK